MKTIALVQSDPTVYMDLKQSLEKDGFKIVSFNMGKSLAEFCLREKPDMVLLDVILPDLDGFEAYRMLQQNPRLNGIPVIFLTSRDSESDRIRGLELGARDYIAKPFYVREAVARIKTHFRRTAKANPILRAGKLEVDRRAFRVRVGDKKVALTATEFNLLEYLMSHPGMVIGREQILDAVWGNQRIVTERTVDVFMLRLRRKLGPMIPAGRILTSVRGFGYRFDPAVAENTVLHGDSSPQARRNDNIEDCA